MTTKIEILFSYDASNELWFSCMAENKSTKATYD